MLNCNRRTPNERNQLETPSSIFTREAGGAARSYGIDAGGSSLWSLLRQLAQTNEGLCWPIFGTAIRAARLISLITVNWWHSETIESIKQTKLGCDEVCFPFTCDFFVVRSPNWGKSPWKISFKILPGYSFCYFLSSWLVWGFLRKNLLSPLSAAFFALRL